MAYLNNSEDKFSINIYADNSVSIIEKTWVGTREFTVNNETHRVKVSGGCDPTNFLNYIKENNNKVELPIYYNNKLVEIGIVKLIDIDNNIINIDIPAFIK